MAQSCRKRTCANITLRLPQKGDVAQPLHHPLWRWRKVGATAQPRGPGRNEKMSAIKIELRDYLETLRGIVPDDLHPHGMMTIWGSTFL